MAPKAKKATSSEERKHKATYAADKKKGGWLVRVAGPYPEKFAGKDVPVTTRDGAEHMEKLVRLIWTGVDNETAEPVSLYTFLPQPRDETNDAEF